MFRADLNEGHARVEVFNGLVEIAGPSGSAKLGKDKVLEYNTGTTEMAFNTERGIAKDSWDKWTEARDSQTSLALKERAAAAHGPVSDRSDDGWSDPQGSRTDSTRSWAPLIGGFPRTCIVKP
jgi:hypothetical protein